MRLPSSPEARWRWYLASLAGEQPPVHEGEPQAGFYAVRKFPYGEWVKGPWIPARVWWEDGEIDPETGELMSDEQCRAEVDGKPMNPWSNWTWLARRPIPQSEFDWLTAQSPLLPKKIPRRR